MSADELDGLPSGVLILPTRERVYEHRITRTHDHGKWVIRFWIESDPFYGGIDYSQAMVRVNAVMMVIQGGLTFSTPRDFADYLLAQVSEANSVEVCDSEGCGTAAHRNWP